MSTYLVGWNIVPNDYKKKTAQTSKAIPVKKLFINNSKFRTVFLQH